MTYRGDSVYTAENTRAAAMDDVSTASTEASGRGPVPVASAGRAYSKRAQRALQLAAWLLCPALFVAACWSMLLAPRAVARWLPHPRQSWLLSGVQDGGPSALPQVFSLAKSPYK